MRLEELTTGIKILETVGDLAIKIENITFDSRKVTANTLFAAIKGSTTDGHQYIDMAIEKGATGILCENLPTDLKAGIVYLKVSDSADALGFMAANFYQHPSDDLQLIGVTGTNGKTTTATLLFDLFTNLGYKCGLLSTVENRIGKDIVPASHTTPDAVALNALLKKMLESDCEYVFMEVSSHAVDQRRIAGLTFAGGMFTNLSHDHLDYHKTFKSYLNAKKRFFDDLPKTAFALTNLDDRNGEVMLQNTKAKKYNYSLRSMADFKAKIIENTLTGLHLDLDGTEFYGRLIGTFNAYNLLSVYATAMLLGKDKIDVLTVLSQLKAAEGRFDYFFSKANGVLAIVDYAHTPDALEKVLMTIDKLRHNDEQLITVVGCGGDRDKKKRPIMAKTACNYSNRIIITSDNPRTEDPEAIIADMEKGVPPTAIKKTLFITNRLQAIKTACQFANKGDIILVAGKGHEKYQDINGVKHPFDDKKILIETLGD